MIENNLTDQMQILYNCYRNPGSTGIRTTPLLAADPDIMLDVIVPAYNVEKYINACLKSILSQKTHYSFRVIVIDDGATDHTGDIVDKYKDHHQVMVIHQKNRGLSGARNTGILHASGKYLLFVDSDDLLAQGAIEQLTNLAEKEEADIVAGSYRNFRQYRWISKNHPQKTGLLVPEYDMTGQACCKICKRSLFERAQFPEGCWFEDSIMHHIIFPQAEKCIGTAKTVIFRRSNPTSITHTAAGNPKSVDTVWVTINLLEDRKTLQIPFSQEYYDYLLEQLRLNHVRLRGLESEIQRAAFLVVADRICKDFPTFQTQKEKNQKTENAVRKMDYDSFATGFER